MMQSFYSAISGMNSMADGLSVSGNNLANAKTTGFKSSVSRFEDLLYNTISSAASENGRTAGTNPNELGNGTKLSSVAVNHTQGNITPTGGANDLAISGNGFFMISEAGGKDYYTRDGSFNLDPKGQLVNNAGLYVQGWNYNPSSGNVDTSASTSAVKINLNQISEPSITTKATINGNLNASAEVGSIVGTQVPVFDSLGARHDIDVNFVKTDTAPAKYTYIASPADDFVASASITDIVFQPSASFAGTIQKGNYNFATTTNPDGTVNVALSAPDGSVLATKTITDGNQNITFGNGTDTMFVVEYKAGGSPSTASFQISDVGTVNFDSTGHIQTLTTAGGGTTPQFGFTPQTTGIPMDVTVDFNSLRGLAAEDTIAVSDYDGFPSAILSSYSISNNGEVTGYFSDGSIQKIAQVATASFANPGGLSQIGGNLYVETANSGIANVGVPGTGDRGTVVAGSLESSNVDTATELTELMFFQKAYTANSKTITTSNSILDVVINLIR